MVYCPLEQQSLAQISKELLGIGAELAAILNEDLYAAVITPGGFHAAAEAGTLGVKRLYYVNDARLGVYTAQGHTTAMERIVKAANPSILLTGATVQGRDIAARLAARLGTGLTADCTELAISETRLLLQTRPAYSGNVIATIICPERRPQMATIRPGVFQLSRRKIAAGAAEVVLVPMPETLPALANVLSSVNRSIDDDILTGAKVVVSCGRGIKNREGVSLAMKLAKALGGVVGGSRGAVEDGLIPRNCQIGQTGKTIRPRLYIACGISGAVQHIVGMKQAECVIAINNNPEAPIFKEADFSICADVIETLPKLIDMVVGKK